MKTTKLITLAAMIGTCSFAAAQGQPNRPDRPIPPEMLKKYDKDGDGKLSDEERKTMRDEMKATREAEMLKKYDKDGDGKLSDEEKATMQADLEAQHKALLEKYDANKNGKLEPEEIKAARDAGEIVPMGRGMGGGPGGPRGARGGKGGPPPAGTPEAPPAQ